MLGLQSFLREVPTGTEEIGDMPRMRNVHDIRPARYHSRIGLALQEMRRRFERVDKTEADTLQLQRPCVRLSLRKGHLVNTRAWISDLQEEHSAKEETAIARQNSFPQRIERAEQ